jgi:hypothetical protein
MNTMTKDEVTKELKTIGASWKAKITEELSNIGAGWAVTSEKCILPEDEYGAKPEYHIHPNVNFPHQSSIKRFPTLNAIVSWVNAVKEAQQYGDLVVVTSPDGKESWTEEA